MKIPRQPLRLLLLVVNAIVLASCQTTLSSNRGTRLDQGVWVSTLPSGYKRMVVDGFTYYVHDGNYFVQKGSRFVTVGSPHATLGAKAEITNPL